MRIFSSGVYLRLVAALTVLTKDLAASVRSSAAVALPVSVWDISTPLSEVLYLIQGADLTSHLSGFSTPSGVPLSLTAYINALTWVQDGMDPSERPAILSLQFSGLQSRKVFWAVLEKPWVKDGLSADEASTIGWLTELSSQSAARWAEAEALELLGMPFLESVDGVDAAALHSLHSLMWRGDGYLWQVLSHPNLSRGITDNNAVIVSVLTNVVRERPELLEVLLDPERTSAANRIVGLPLVLQRRFV